MSYENYFEAAKRASKNLLQIEKGRIDQILRQLATELKKQSEYLLHENKKDLERMPESDPKFDRLKLTKERIADIANDLENVANLRSPLGDVLLEKTLDSNQLSLKKVRVPLGLVGVIYESRPNVTVDVFSLCFKTGNVALLKGGSDAEYSNIALAKVIKEVLADNQVSVDVITLLPAERQATEALLNASKYVDVLIPRGSQSLIDYVRQHSKIPVIETGAGIVHTFFDASADLEKGRNIILNAKTRRVSVCNALDCTLVHQSRLLDCYSLFAPLADKNVELYADEQSYEALKGAYPAHLLHTAQAAHYGTEFLSLKMAIKTVKDIDEALAHIERYSSKHSEAIISEDTQNIALFMNQVDAAAVYANASTAFTDGAQFGLGAEIGISTQKLHARGPMALEELTSYKWQINGKGQTRD